jgi:hypothetical protein
MLKQLVVAGVLSFFFLVFPIQDAEATGQPVPKAAFRVQGDAGTSPIELP